MQHYSSPSSKLNYSQPGPPGADLEFRCVVSEKVLLTFLTLVISFTTIFLQIGMPVSETPTVPPSVEEAGES